MRMSDLPIMVTIAGAWSASATLRIVIMVAGT